MLNSEGEVGENRDPDQEISTISSKLFTKVYGRSPDGALCQKKQTADQWHSDIAFEPVPADFSSLRLTEVPKTGGGKRYHPPSIPMEYANFGDRHTLGIRL